MNGCFFSSDVQKWQLTIRTRNLEFLENYLDIVMLVELNSRIVVCGEDALRISSNEKITHCERYAGSEQQLIKFGSTTRNTMTKKHAIITESRTQTPKQILTTRLQVSVNSFSSF